MKFNEHLTRKKYAKVYRKDIFNFIFPIVYGSIRKNGDIMIEGNVNNSHHLHVGGGNFEYANKISDILACLTYSRTWVGYSIKMPNGDQLMIESSESLPYLGFFPVNQMSLNHVDHVYNIMVDSGLYKLASHYLKSCLTNADKIVDVEYLNEKLNEYYKFERYI